MMDLEFENRLKTIAGGMEYPPTPDITGRVMTRLRSFPSPVGRGGRGEGRPRLISRRAAWSLTIILVLLSSLLLIPPVRAAVIEFIQIGIVRIFPRFPEPTPGIVAPTAPGVTPPSTATPGASLPSWIPLLDDIAGETKLANAQQMTEYPILLPTYPPDLGQPDHVYVQEADGAMTILVWEDPLQPGRVVLSLHFIPEGSWAIKKFEPAVIQETEVNGRRAVWTEGPYPLILSNGNVEFTRLVDGHALIWTDGIITYRLETELGMEEAIKAAESLQPIP